MQKFLEWVIEVAHHSKSERSLSWVSLECCLIAEIGRQSI